MVWKKEVVMGKLDVSDKVPALGISGKVSFLVGARRVCTLLYLSEDSNCTHIS